MVRSVSAYVGSLGYNFVLTADCFCQMVVVLLWFFVFFSSCSGLDQLLVSAWLRFCFCSGWLFLWWLGGGWLSFWWMVVLILWVFSFSFLPASGCGAVICGGGGYGGLWLLQWWLWQVERWWRRWLLQFFVQLFYYYFNEQFILFK